MIDESTTTGIWQSKNNDSINIVTVSYQAFFNKLFLPMLMPFSFKPEVLGRRTASNRRSSLNILKLQGVQGYTQLC